MALTLFDIVLIPISPLTDLYALLLLVTGDFGPLFWAAILTILAQLLTTGLAIHLAGERYRALIHAPGQLLFFRYFTLLVSATALSSALTGRREKWNKPKRVGLSIDQRPLVSTQIREENFATKELVETSS